MRVTDPHSRHVICCNTRNVAYVHVRTRGRLKFLPFCSPPTLPKHGIIFTECKHRNRLLINLGCPLTTLPMMELSQP